MPYVGDTGADRRRCRPRRSRRSLAARRPGLGLAADDRRAAPARRRARPRRRRATARSAAIDGEFVLFTGGLALDAEMGALMPATWSAEGRAGAVAAARGHYLNFAEQRGRHLALPTTRSRRPAAGRQGPRRPGQRDPRQPRHLESQARMGARSTTASTSGWRLDRAPADVLRRAPPRPATTGHINVSPEGADRLAAGARRRTRSPTWTSSAAARRRSPTCARTAASCVMFCAFEGPPRIVRLHGEGEVICPATRRSTQLLALGFHEPEAPEARRAIIACT